MITNWFKLNTFSEFISNNTHTFEELLPNKSKHISRVHIKHYWHFAGVTPKEYYTLFQTSSNTDMFREWQTIQHTFSEFISSNTDIFREWQTIQHTFSEFISSNTDIFREWQTIQHTLSEFISSNTDIFREWRTIQHTFSGFISSNTDIFKDFLPN